MAPGTTVFGTSLLDDLAFDLDGTSYTEATANAVALTFDAQGLLASVLLGTQCSGACSVSTGITGFAMNFAGLSYARTGMQGIFSGAAPVLSLRTGAVPEPGSAALVLVALLGVAAAGGRRRPCPAAPCL